MDFQSFITKTNDWPRYGITTYDMAPLLRDAAAFEQAVRGLAAPYVGTRVDAVAGIEARGFILASALARALGTGVIMIRKKGKIPPPTISQDYSLEYASHIIEVSPHAIKSGDRIVLVDDILATGGTMAAAVKLVSKLNPTIVGLSFLLEVGTLAGRDRLQGLTVHSVIGYD